jgi:hypothetical protein
MSNPERWHQAAVDDESRIQQRVAEILRWGQNVEGRIDCYANAAERRVIYVALGVVAALKRHPNSLEIIDMIPQAAKDLGKELQHYVETGRELPRPFLQLYQPLADLAFTLTECLPLHRRLAEEPRQAAA